MATAAMTIRPRRDDGGGGRRCFCTARGAALTSAWPPGERRWDKTWPSVLGEIRGRDRAGEPGESVGGPTHCSTRDQPRQWIGGDDSGGGALSATPAYAMGSRKIVNLLILGRLEPQKSP